MKTLLAALAAAATLGFASAAFALPAPETCTSASKSAEVPSGSYTDSHGRKWAGYKQNGAPPDSLSSDSTNTTCETTYTPI